MNWRLILWSGLGAAALFVMIGGAWILSLPPAPAVATAPSIATEEADATVAALPPAATYRLLPPK
jgi:hypothetical protein